MCMGAGPTFTSVSAPASTAWLQILAPVLRLGKTVGGALILDGICPKRRQEPEKSAGFADTYHGKVLPLESARRLVMVNEDVVLRDLEKIIPIPKPGTSCCATRTISWRWSAHAGVHAPNPCLPLDVCLIIGEPFAGFVAEHHPRRSRWITQEEAVGILQAENERGHVHHAFFKDAMFGRYYAICNCCTLLLRRDAGAAAAARRCWPPLATSAELDEALCIGCGECIETCQFGALSLDGVTSRVDAEKCMGCGVCVSHCAQGALSLERDAARGEPLEILELMQKAGAEI